MIPIRRRVGLLLGPAGFLLLLLLPAPTGLSSIAWRTAAVGVLMAVWWVTEAIPIPATALLPLVAFPLLGVRSIGETAAPYANPVIYLFLGGFMIALAMERVGLHRRLAVQVLRAVGTRPAALVGGMIAVTGFASMWVSNTATVLMMLPMAQSLAGLAVDAPGDERTRRNFGVALLLGVAYAASIGGLGTLIGTPPNALLAAFAAETLGIRIGFAQWMAFAVPLVVVALPLCWWLLVRVCYPVGREPLAGGSELVARERRALGPPGPGERRVAAVAVIVALAWVCQPLLEPLVPGLSDTGIAILGALAMFFIPLGDGSGERALDWSHAERLPWSVLVLFGGGLSLAAAIQDTGLAAWAGATLSGLRTLPVAVVVLATTALVVFLTELTSNTATAAALLPVAASVATAVGADPLVLAVPTALAASCGFMMPVGTPPNALVYATGRVTMGQMVRAGFWLNLLLVALIGLALATIGPVVFPSASH